jgi:hypothetical protein
MNAQQQTFDILRGHIEPDTARKLLLDYLCYDQMGEDAYGEDDAGNSVKINWIDRTDGGYWSIKQYSNGQLAFAEDEYGGCEKAVGNLDDDILFDMCERLGLEPDYEQETAE